MKKHMIRIMAVAMFTMTLAVTSAHAQNAGGLAVTIPFEFAVAGKTLPAGDYYVRRNIDNSSVGMQIRSKDNTKSVHFAMTHTVQGRRVQEESKLVFNRYGSQFFLSQIWIAGRSTGDELNRTNRERGLQRELAQLNSKPETVSVAVRSR